MMSSVDPPGDLEFCKSLSAALRDWAKTDIAVGSPTRTHCTAALEDQFHVWMFLRQVRLRLEPVQVLRQGKDPQELQSESAACEAPDADDGRSLIHSILQADLPSALVHSLRNLSFEARKDSMWLLMSVLRCGHDLPDLRDSIVGYIRARPDMLRLLVEGCCAPDVALICGHLLRYCARYPELVVLLLDECQAADKLLTAVRDPDFDVACEAWASLRSLLLVQKEAGASYLLSHFEDFFASYKRLLQDEYIARRQALQLLCDMLLDRSFSTVMLRYVCDESFLRLHMNLLLDKSPKIQLSAFHILKIFVANPAKPARVEAILRKNAEKMCQHVTTLPRLRFEDDDLLQDVRAVLDVLRTMPGAGATAIRPSTSAAHCEAATEQGRLASDAALIQEVCAQTTAF